MCYDPNAKWSISQSGTKKCQNAKWFPFCAKLHNGPEIRSSYRFNLRNASEFFWRLHPNSSYVKAFFTLANNASWASMSYTVQIGLRGCSFALSPEMNVFLHVLQATKKFTTARIHIRARILTSKRNQTHEFLLSSLILHSVVERSHAWTWCNLYSWLRQRVFVVWQADLHFWFIRRHLHLPLRQSPLQLHFTSCRPRIPFL